MSENSELPCGVIRKVWTWSEWKIAVENAGIRDGDLVEDIHLSLPERPIRARKARRFGTGPEAWFID